MAKAKALVSSSTVVRKAKAPKSTANPKPVPQDLDSWLAGYEAGLCNKPCQPPKRLPLFTHVKVQTDTGAWHHGYIEGIAQNRASDVVRAVRGERGGGEVVNYSRDPVLRAVGTWGASGAFKAGVRYAVEQARRGRPLSTN